MDFKLIRASIALFQGKRLETQRLLREYAAENGNAEAKSPLVGWLDAQSQPERDERLKRLQELVDTGDGDNQNIYARMSARHLEDERKYDTLLNPAARSRSGLSILGVPVGKTLIFLIAGGLLSFFLFSALNLGGSSNTPDATPTLPPGTSQPILEVTTTDGQTVLLPTITPTLPIAATNIPVTEWAVDPTKREYTYEAGTLQIAAIEESSSRVMEISNPVLPTVVPGGAYYAIKIIFTCRSGVCYEPPEAKLRLVLLDETEIEPKEDVGIMGQGLLSPIAAGQTTEGWIVFEIPLTSRPNRLKILPNGTEGEPTPTPSSIDATVSG